jgi:hypothetical protein
MSGETPADVASKLHWRFTCERHQQLFIWALQRGGLAAAEDMERVRRHFSVWLAEQYPRLFIDHMNAERCIGCDLEAAHIDLSTLFPKILELARKKASE